MQRIGDWALELETISFSDRTAFYYDVFCRLAKLIQVKSATLQRFQLAFKHLLLLEKNSRLHPIFQDFAFNFHTFSRSGKVVRKFPDFFKNSRLCTNPGDTSLESVEQLRTKECWIRRPGRGMLNQCVILLYHISSGSSKCF